MDARSFKFRYSSEQAVTHQIKKHAWVFFDLQCCSLIYVNTSTNSHLSCHMSPLWLHQCTQCVLQYYTDPKLVLFPIITVGSSNRSILSSTLKNCNITIYPSATNAPHHYRHPKYQPTAWLLFLKRQYISVPWVPLLDVHLKDLVVTLLMNSPIDPDI